MRKYISFFLAFILIISALAGCSKSETAYDFIYPFDADVNSYDPQVASTSDEYLIIENTFEGLIRVNDDGEVVPGVSDKWDISEDGLTYTFHIPDGIKWNINTDKYTDGDNKGKFKDERLEMMGKEFNPDITADDFVFALQRAASKVTDCPMFSSISCIKNANAVHSGQMAENSLGVTAENPNVLKITLEHKDDSFMQTLSSAVAMPCNEEFFNATKGRYGLDTKYTLFNGQFYLSQILESSYLLKKNTYYTGPSPTKAKELTLKIPTDDERTKILSKLESGYYDAAFISGHESADIKKSSGVTYTEYCDTTWAMVFNTNDEAFQSKNLRKAFCLGFSHPDSFGAEYISNANNFIPSSSKIGANDAGAAMGKTTVGQDESESIADWKKALGVLKTTSIEAIILTPDYMQDYVKQLLQGIQSGLGASLKDSKGNNITLTLKVEAMSEDDIKTAIAMNEYDIAFLPFKASNDDAIGFISSVNDSGYGDFDNDKVSDYLTKAQNAQNLNDIADCLKSAENEIISSYSLCPVIYESSYYACAKGVSDVQFHLGSGRVNFVNAKRK